MCGSNQEGMLGLGEAASLKLSTFTQVPLKASHYVETVVCGESHTVVLARVKMLPPGFGGAHDVLMAGKNDDGRLGLGGTRAHHYNFSVIGQLQHKRVTHLSAGGYQTSITITGEP